MSNFNEERRKMRFEQVERMLNSDITITEWCKLNKVAKSTMLEDGHLELSNNIAERARRIFVRGRKNWLFSDTPAGAHASAAIYSITTTAKANGLNPRLYIEWLLTEMPNAGKLTDEVIDSFLPWSHHLNKNYVLTEQKTPYSLTTHTKHFHHCCWNTKYSGQQSHHHVTKEKVPKIQEYEKDDAAYKIT